MQIHLAQTYGVLKHLHDFNWVNSPGESMSVIKVALRASKAALDRKDYDEAEEQAKKVLEIDADNYHAYVSLPRTRVDSLNLLNRNIFLGLALDQKNMLDKSEQAYRAAATFKPDEALAWQGLIALYEKQLAAKLEEYHQAAFRLAEIFMIG